MQLYPRVIADCSKFTDRTEQVIISLIGEVWFIKYYRHLEAPPALFFFDDIPGAIKKANNITKDWILFDNKKRQKIEKIEL